MKFSFFIVNINIQKCSQNDFLVLTASEVKINVDCQPSIQSIFDNLIPSQCIVKDSKVGPGVIAAIVIVIVIAAVIIIVIFVLKKRKENHSSQEGNANQK